jgi:hypothetical protein
MLPSPLARFFAMSIAPFFGSHNTYHNSLKKAITFWTSSVVTAVRFWRGPIVFGSAQYAPNCVAPWRLPG